MGIIAWIIFGLIAGAIAKLIMPGNDGGGFILTCVLGVVGAVVGGWLATMFGFGATLVDSTCTVSLWLWWAPLLSGHIQVAPTGIDDTKRLSRQGRFVVILIC